LKTKTLALTFVLALSISSMVAVQTVKAQGLSIDLEFVWSPPAYVNQPFQIAATVSGGTPPYTYQWYTKWFPPWEPGMDPEQYRASSGSEITVPGATSATFWFTPTVEGIYWISVGVSDSAGQSVSRFPSIQPFQLIVQNPQQLNLTIKPDGSVEPSTNLLERNGNTYNFKGDIFGTITVRRAGITIDGAGYTLQGNQTVNVRAINLVGHDETFNAYGNVLVKNLRIYNFSEGIYTPSNNNSFIGNRFERAGIHILGGSGLGNVIKNNVFINSVIFVDYNHGGHDIITENNFFDGGTLVDLADAPFVDRNYWSNYTVKYPNATEVEGLGIWDTPYVDEIAWATNRSIDYHPLVNPITDLEIPNFSLPPFPSTRPSVSVLPTINTGTEPPQIEPFPTTLLLGSVVIVAVVAVVVAGLLVYQKNTRKI